MTARPASAHPVRRFAFRQHLLRAAAAVGLLALLPATVSAQSAIVGVVRDTSAAVLPGVTVEVSSPALIEGALTTVTDAEGRYRVVNLRPGTYKVTFALPEFSTFTRDGVLLRADFTATVDGELKVGAIEQSVTVSGRSPVVDVNNVQRTHVLPRDLVDSVPTGRTFAAVGALAVGVRVSTPNVGGVRTAAQQRVVAYGSLAGDTTVSVDGMKSNAGDDQHDHNDGMTAEFTVQTGGLGAEVARGGPHINLIPREGGNILSGASYFGFTNNAMQSDNLGDLPSRGLLTPDAVDLIYFANVSLGGPVIRDRFWFFAGYGNNWNSNIIANSFYPDGSPGKFDQRVTNTTLRLTSQITRKNKISAYMDYATKWIGHETTSGGAFGGVVDIATASLRRPPGLKYTGATKWTSIISDSLLFETGLFMSANNVLQLWQPGIAKDPFTPEWYANASRVDLTRSTTTRAPISSELTESSAYIKQFISSLSYVSGAHSFKTGVQWQWGTQTIAREDSNGALVQRYRDGIPDSVQVFNTPTRSRTRMNADLGFYVQDSWRATDRLTIVPGVRFEFMNAERLPSEVRGSRFVPFRSVSGLSDLPNWFNVAPRFGIIYSLTGDGKTALKGTINRYNRNFTFDIATRYDPLALQSDVRNWADCDYVPGTSRCSGLALATNGDDIAQDNEIGPSNNARFGLGQDRRFDPESKRPFDMEYTIGVDRELIAGLSLAGTWFRRESYNRPLTLNELVDVTDFAAFQVANPLSGEPVTIYNLNPAKQGLVRLLDTTADRSLSRASYNGLEMILRGQLPGGGSVLGGWSAGKAVDVSCADFSNPNTFYNCDQSTLGVPFRHNFKVSGSYPLPFEFTFAGSLLSNAGSILGSNVFDGSLSTLWAVPANLFPGGRTQSVTLRVDRPGSQWLDRWNQLDLSVKRMFNIRRTKMEPAIEVYNMLNSNVVLAQNQNFGTSLGVPVQILQGRLVRLSAQVKF